MKLHVGCGMKYLNGWKHSDVKNLEHVDYCCDARDIEKHIVPSSLNELYACHILEHFGRHEVDSVLESWSKLLQPGGQIRLAVPDIEAVCEHYQEHKNLSILRGLLWGGQRDTFDFHTIGFDYEDLKTRLERVGFEDVRRYDWREFLPEGFDDYSRSYLPHLDFENGKLMSLNIVAIKK